MRRGKITSGSAASAAPGRPLACGQRVQLRAAPAPAARHCTRQRLQPRRRGTFGVQHEAGVDLVGGERVELHVQGRLAQRQLRRPGWAGGSRAASPAAARRRCWRRRPGAVARPARRPRPGPAAGSASAAASSRRSAGSSAAPAGASATRRWRALRTAARRACAPAAGSPGSAAAGSCAGAARRGRSAAPRPRPRTGAGVAARSSIDLGGSMVGW